MGNPAAQRARLGKKIGRTQVVEGGDDGRPRRAALKVPGQQVDGGLEVEGSGLVLDVHHVDPAFADYLLRDAPEGKAP